MAAVRRSEKLRRKAEQCTINVVLITQPAFALVCEAGKYVSEIMNPELSRHIRAYLGPAAI